MSTPAEQGRERAETIVAMLRDQIDDVVSELGDDGEEAFLDRLFEAAEDFWVDLIRERLAPRAIGNPRAVIIKVSDIERDREMKGGSFGEAFSRLIELSGIDRANGVYVERCDMTRSFYVVEGTDQSIPPSLRDMIRGEQITREFKPPKRTRDRNHWAYVT